MSFSASTYHVLITSPSDLADEREAATQAIYDWNVQHAAAKGLSGNKSLIWRSWREGVVPLAVELIARDVKPSHLGIGHRHALGIAVRVKLAPHAQARPGGGCADQVHDDTIARVPACPEAGANQSAREAS